MALASIVSELFIVIQLANVFSRHQPFFINANSLALGIKRLSDGSAAILTTTEWNCHRRIDSNDFGNSQTFPAAPPAVSFDCLIAVCNYFGDPLSFPLICKCIF